MQERQKRSLIRIRQVRRLIPARQVRRVRSALKISTFTPGLFSPLVLRIQGACQRPRVRQQRGDHLEVPWHGQDSGAPGTHR
jgi:hypothetical protein